MIADMMERAEKSQGIEYAIYTFDPPEGDGASRSRWQKRDTKSEMPEALAAAEKIFRSGRYEKVEVKQKFFDRKQNRNVDVTLKIFENQGKKEINFATILLFALLCGAAAFTVTYFLNK